MRHSSVIRAFIRYLRLFLYVFRLQEDLRRNCRCQTKPNFSMKNRAAHRFQSVAECNGGPLNRREMGDGSLSGLERSANLKRTTNIVRTRQDGKRIEHFCER